MAEEKDPDPWATIAQMYAEGWTVHLTLDPTFGNTITFGTLATVDFRELASAAAMISGAADLARERFQSKQAEWQVATSQGEGESQHQRPGLTVRPPSHFRHPEVGSWKR